MKIIKTIVVFFLLLLPVIIFGNPQYVELNDLAIIRGVGVSCGEEINLYFQEIIPIKGDSGINYEYEYYQSDGNNLENAFHKLNLKTKKKLYLSKVKFLVSDCKKSDFILKQFDFKREDIHIDHVKNQVFEKVKDTKM